MPPIKIDFTNVQSGGTPVDEGSHICALFSAKWTTTKKGDPMLKVVWKCQTGDPNEGRQIFDQYPIMESTWWKVKLLLEALGEDVSGEYTFPDDLNALCGRLAVVFVEHEDYQGKTQARVTEIHAVDPDAPGAEVAAGRGRRGKNPF